MLDVCTHALEPGVEKPRTHGVPQNAWRRKLKHVHMCMPVEPRAQVGAVHRRQHDVDPDVDLFEFAFAFLVNRILEALRSHRHENQLTNAHTPALIW